MSNYAKAVKVLLEKGETLTNLSDANRLALQMKKITMKEFQEVAEILVKAFLYE